MGGPCNLPIDLSAAISILGYVGGRGNWREDEMVSGLELGRWAGPSSSGVRNQKLSVTITRTLNIVNVTLRSCVNIVC